MGKEKAHINVVVVGHVDSEKSTTNEEPNKPVVEKQAAEMNMDAIWGHDDDLNAKGGTRK